MGSTFYLDTLSFKQCVSTNGQLFPTSDPFFGDVGNIIFNHGVDNACGYFQGSLSNLTSQGDFWTNPSNWTVDLYSTNNPATYYSGIEMAMAPYIINGGNYNTFQDLDVRYGGTHGITFWGGSGSPTHDSTVIDCDVSWCGGGYYNSTLRYGNAIQVWADATNILIEDNKIWQIYDIGLDYENSASNAPAAAVNNVAFENNVVWDCGEANCSFSLLNTASTLNGFEIENNTLVDAGYSWANAQRTDIVGWDLGLIVNQASTTANFVVLDNICSGALHADVYIASGWTVTGFTMDYNLFYQPNDNDLVADWYNNWTDMDWFASYQYYFGEDAHSHRHHGPVYPLQHLRRSGKR